MGDTQVDAAKALLKVERQIVKVEAILVELKDKRLVLLAGLGG